MTRVVMSLLILATTVMVVLRFLNSDQTPRTMMLFVVLYLVGIVWPGVWTFQLHQALRPGDRRTRALAWSPVMVGSTTILIGMATFM